MCIVEREILRVMRSLKVGLAVNAELVDFIENSRGSDSRTVSLLWRSEQPLWRCWI